MADKISPQQRHRNMQAIKSKDTKPELIVRKLLFNAGYRYRLHRKELPGNPDICFIGKKKVIFVNGCFWHQHPDENCVDAHIPKSNQKFWCDKLQKNKERDSKNYQKLVELGYMYLIIWECEVQNLDMLFKRLKDFLNN